MELNKNNYKLFTVAEFQNIIGKNLNDILSNESLGLNSDYFITYVCVQVMSYIEEHSGRKLYKEISPTDSNDYDLYYGFKRSTALKLSESTIEKIKLACIYQADYIIDNGSTERMSGIFVRGGASKYSMKDFEVCEICRRFLSNAGLLYAGIGVGTNAWFE